MSSRSYLVNLNLRTQYLKSQYEIFVSESLSFPNLSQNLHPTSWWLLVYVFVEKIPVWGMLIGIDSPLSSFLTFSTMIDLKWIQTPHRLPGPSWQGPLGQMQWHLWLGVCDNATVNKSRWLAKTAAYARACCRPHCHCQHCANMHSLSTKLLRLRVSWGRSCQWIGHCSSCKAKQFNDSLGWHWG